MPSSLKILLLALVAFVSTRSLAGEPVAITDSGLNGVNVNKYIEHYVEPSYVPLDRSLKVLSKLNEFKPLPEASRLGHKDTPIWFTLEMVNRSSKDIDIFLELPRQYFWQVNMFVIRSSGTPEEKSRGLESKLANLEYPTSKSDFSVHLNRDEKVRLLFYSITNGPIDLTTQMFSVLPYIRGEYQANLLNGIFYGIMIGLILYNAFIFLVLGDFAYLFYVLWATSLALFFSTLNGVGVTYLWPEAGAWNRIFIFLFVGLFLTFEVMALASFLTNLEDKHERVLKRIAFSVGLFTTILALMDPFWNYAGKGAATNLMALCAVTVMLMLLYLAYRSSRKGFRPAKLLIVAYVPFAAVTILRGLAQVGWASPLFHQNFIHQISASVEMIFMSIALADRINYLTKLHRMSESEKEEIKIKHIKLVEQEKLKARENEAIMKTTQMLAHDVRKPFSILRMGLTMLGNAKDPEKVKSLLTRLVPEVDRAVNTVDGLISDVMEIGSTSSQLMQESVYPEALIEATLNDVFRVYPKAKITIAYDLRHSMMTYAHVQKAARVFSNIYGNALQAMDYSGATWFKTRDVSTGGRNYIEFCIGNAGSLIPEASVSKIFEAFFTSGKKAGTGLGLAIAQKVVLAHGGVIRCESSVTADHPAGKVEFFFTLPASESAKMAYRGTLPTDSIAITKVLLSSSSAEGSDSSQMSTAHHELELEAEVNEAVKHLGRPLHVLIADDEDVYRQALQASFSRTQELAKNVSVKLATGSVQALRLLSAEHFDLVITDVDMGSNSLNGFDLVREVRTMPGAAPAECLICVHSNRIVAQDHRTAINSGADAFLSKPASRSQLLKLVLQACHVAVSCGSQPVDSTVPAGLLEVAVVDDNPFILEAWIDTLSGEALAYSSPSPEEFLTKLAADPELLGRLACVILDQNFDHSEETGIGLAKTLKAMRPELIVLLSSDATFTAADLLGCVDRVIAKDPASLVELGIQPEFRRLRSSKRAIELIH